MSCDKCYGRYEDDDNELNRVHFDGCHTYHLCDHCTELAYKYLRDFF